MLWKQDLYRLSLKATFRLQKDLATSKKIFLESEAHFKREYDFFSKDFARSEKLFLKSETRLKRGQMPFSKVVLI